jgi:hypothetical protein
VCAYRGPVVEAPHIPHTSITWVYVDMRPYLFSDKGLGALITLLGPRDHLRTHVFIGRFQHGDYAASDCRMENFGRIISWPNLIPLPECVWTA